MMQSLCTLPLLIAYSEALDKNDFELEAWIQGRDFPVRIDPGGVVPLGCMLRAVSRVDAAGTQWVLLSLGLKLATSDAGDITDCIQYRTRCVANFNSNECNYGSSTVNSNAPYLYIFFPALTESLLLSAFRTKACRFLTVGGSGSGNSWK
jgi:hypothetical protein